MIRTVMPNKHRFNPPLWKITFGRNRQKVVCFKPNCRYDLKDSDQDDWNKLFGVKPLNFRSHHFESYRFVWRYNLLTRKIELGAYCYQKGVNVKALLKSIHINHEYFLELKQIGNKVHFFINGESYFDIVGTLPLIGWQLSAYFGGNEKATHEMDIFIS